MAPRSPLLSILLVLGLVYTTAAFNYPIGVNTWCGKACRNTWVLPRSRTNHTETFKQYVVWTPWKDQWADTVHIAATESSNPTPHERIHYRWHVWIGNSWCTNILHTRWTILQLQFQQANKSYLTFTTLFVDISVDDTGLNLVSFRKLTINSTANEFVFSLAGLTPQLEPYNLSIVGASGDGNHSYVATTKFYVLPNRSDRGSTVKIDSLFGGLVMQDFGSNSTKWTSLFPYT